MTTNTILFSSSGRIFTICNCAELHIFSNPIKIFEKEKNILYDTDSCASVYTVHKYCRWSRKYLKGQCHEICWHFFISWIKAIWAPDKQAKMVLLKSSFSRRNSRKIRLRAVLACAESKIEIFANPKLANTARSHTLRRLTLRVRRVKQIFQIFEYLHLQGI